jgi:hypothetical protein
MHSVNTSAHEHLPCVVIACGCVGAESFALCAGSDAEDAQPVQKTMKMASKEVGANAAHVHTKLTSGAKRGNSPLAAPRSKQQKKAGKAGCFKLQPMGKGNLDSTVNMQTYHTVMAVLSENGNAMTADVRVHVSSGLSWFL